MNNSASSAPIRLGVVGAASRGAAFKNAIELTGSMKVQAVCDLNEAGLIKAQLDFGAPERFTLFEEMIARADIDAVLLGTPMPFHARQSIAALDKGLHVLCEVPAVVSVEEARALEAACRRSKAVYMMAENYTFTRPNMMVRELVKRGLFGETYYAEGEYLHELKQLNKQTPWRRDWQTGRAGITYGTHSLGPILQWMPGDRIVSVCVAGGGMRHRDARGELFENESSTVMLGKTAHGGLVKIRVDMLSDRPHAMTNYSLQGTNGCYESARAAGEHNRIWLRSRCAKDWDWETLEALEREFLPAAWRDFGDAAQAAGHGGGDLLELLHFCDAIIGRAPLDLGIHAALDATLPGLISQQSALQNGRWLDVPDSRAWEGEKPAQAQLQMLWPSSKTPAPTVAEGYVLRASQPSDASGIRAVLAASGLAVWTDEELESQLKNTLPRGCFVVEHLASGTIVATAQARHAPGDLHPEGGEVGWVAAHPDHSGKQLGRSVVAAATLRLQQAGYTRIFLLTDDFRLPAIKTYVALGFEPFLFEGGMKVRWENLSKNGLAMGGN
ncbi:MAG TPA: GNAT family N-acetyltransferase [Abditibacteriaceae bacterium]|jgi:predicted dehydrogenase/GNAT superfamily N-acetyltransferase